MAPSVSRWVSNAEYLARYEREVRHYVARYALVRNTTGPGEAFLSSGRWAWIESDDDARARWDRYARAHRPLKAMNQDGTWRAWEPWDVR
jgi:hypothetical protein